MSPPKSETFFCRIEIWNKLLASFWKYIKFPTKFPGNRTLSRTRYIKTALGFRLPYLEYRYVLLPLVSYSLLIYLKL